MAISYHIIHKCYANSANETQKFRVSQLGRPYLSTSTPQNTVACVPAVRRHWSINKTEHLKVKLKKTKNWKIGKMLEEL